MDGRVVAAGEVALTGPLHLDHPGAEIGELAGGEGGGDGLLQADHRDPGQGTLREAHGAHLYGRAEHAVNGIHPR
ncbi:hypothetical protein SALBM311S_05868 [Streptomyces alboniger]